jgi:hypothetical protein
MTSRREFLEAAAFTALPAIAGVSLANAATKPVAGSTPAAVGPSATATSDFHLVLFDSRYSEARTAATRIGRAGTPVHALHDGDITQVWLDHVGPAWQRGPAIIAGVTARPALFCLEQFAVSTGLRVVFHAEHVVYANGRAEHFLRRGADIVGLSQADLTQAGPQWTARIADALAAYRPDAARPRPGRSDAALEPVLPPRAQLLTSWIIAAA